MFEAQRAVIESCVNSFVDGKGRQKQFGTEIDLFYPPNSREFFGYMKSTVDEALSLISTVLSKLEATIVRHSGTQARELYAVAGKTEFDLRKGTDVRYSEAEAAEAFARTIAEIEEMGADERVIELLREQQKLLR